MSFWDIWDIIERLRRRMMEEIEEAEGMFREPEKDEFGRHIVFGFSMGMGPDGKPIIREFGNVKPVGKRIVTSEVREPFVDVIYDDTNNEVKIIAEMPGVTRDKIDVEASADSVHIRAEDHNRKYETTVPLNAKIDPKSAKASYKNGVLEIRFKTKEPLKKGGVRINVE